MHCRAVQIRVSVKFVQLSARAVNLCRSSCTLSVSEVRRYISRRDIGVCIRANGRQLTFYDYTGGGRRRQ